MSDPVAHLKNDMLACAMRDLGYALEAIDCAVERAAHLVLLGLTLEEAEHQAVAEVDRWPEAQRRHAVHPRAEAA